MPGETKTLDYTIVTPGAYKVGCHVNGHYAAGMKAAITVTPKGRHGPPRCDPANTAGPFVTFGT